MEQSLIARFGYAEDFKQQVIREVLAGNSMESLRRKYGIKGKMTINNWLRKKGISTLWKKGDIVAFKADKLKKKQPATPPQEASNEDLQRKIDRLEQELLEAKVKAQMLERMMELTEQELKINIRKNGNTK